MINSQTIDVYPLKEKILVEIILEKDIQAVLKIAIINEKLSQKYNRQLYDLKWKDEAKLLYLYNPEGFNNIKGIILDDESLMQDIISRRLIFLFIDEQNKSTCIHTYKHPQIQEIIEENEFMHIDSIKYNFTSKKIEVKHIDCYFLIKDNVYLLVYDEGDGRLYSSFLDMIMIDEVFYGIP